MTPASTCLRRSFQADPSSVREARLAVADAVAPLVSEQELIDDVRLCVSEAVTNVIVHAYERKPGRVEVVVEHEGDELTVVVRDDGVGPRRSTPRGTAGGFGLRIVKEIASRHAIVRAPGGGTELQMVFSLGRRSAPSTSGTHVV